MGTHIEREFQTSNTRRCERNKDQKRSNTAFADAVLVKVQWKTINMTAKTATYYVSMLFIMHVNIINPIIRQL